ncbi:hypothetical protein ASZ78_002120 [Callipepla squamata]|uniref:Uncharacterized protein n=1 Tax=Callipepla squamata TaxID=9009 RepID=A0A226MLX0_CALSU|nr:hypothetical protein ASZ78_002120 [Callipepla squamata]
MHIRASDAGLNPCVLRVFSDCREEQFPCTRLYSVHKPVKQCISYLCVTSDEFEGNFDYLSTCIYLLCLQMRSVASWLAFLLDVSTDLGNSYNSLASSS